MRVLYLLSLCLVSACSFGANKQELKQYLRFQDVELTGNYQAIAKCWDENSKDVTLLGGQTSVQIYTDLKLAEIWHGNDPGYFIMAELKPLTGNKTSLSIYAVPGYVGDKYPSEWLALFKACQS